MKDFTGAVTQLLASFSLKCEQQTCWKTEELLVFKMNQVLNSVNPRKKVGSQCRQNPRMAFKVDGL